DGERYADQKYLDTWPDEVRSLAIIHHPGANLAPWNVMRHRVSLEREGVSVDGRHLVFFHFHRIDRRTESLYETDLAVFGTVFDSILRTQIYGCYVKALVRIEDQLHRQFGWKPSVPLCRPTGSIRQWLFRTKRLFIRTRVIFRHGEA